MQQEDAAGPSAEDGLDQHGVDRNLLISPLGGRLPPTLHISEPETVTYTVAHEVQVTEGLQGRFRAQHSVARPAHHQPAVHAIHARGPRVKLFVPSVFAVYRAPARRARLTKPMASRVCVALAWLLALMTPISHALKIAGLRVNRALKVLALAHNQIGEDSKSKLQEAVQGRAGFHLGL